ncbi:MAG: signal recognition particle protein [Gammaproteobacteria bacterium GWE2_37_16]|nr:MAG: signal recognition particle protein [Gammaproteobacteria bacterium GWE2_37_16]
MFKNLSSRLTQTIRDLTGRGRLTEENIKETLSQVRIALLEADVALPVVKQFTDEIQVKAIGQEVMQSLRPGEVLIKFINDELIKTLGESNVGLNLQTQPPAVIMVVGLQGSGKTTTIAKLANWLKESQKKKVLLASADVYRPAAIDQLQTLAKQIDVPFYLSDVKDKPINIAIQAIKAAKSQLAEIVLIDTAGRLHIDEEMMTELVDMQKAINPIETLLVVDSMAGQDAANIAKTFNEKLALTGIILTKTDGDARGGAALSMRFLTDKPIKFIGTGEKIHALEPFYPERIASRILDMGDIVSLVEEVQQKVDHEKAEKLTKKLFKGKTFDLQDFKEQLQQMRSMGGIQSLISKLPGIGQLPSTAKDMINDKLFVKMEAIINSMTPRERRFPALIKGSHKRRLAAGSGTDIQDINRLLKQFEQMQKMMKRLKGGKLMNMMRHFNLGSGM